MEITDVPIIAKILYNKLAVINGRQGGGYINIPSPGLETLKCWISRRPKSVSQCQGCYSEIASIYYAQFHTKGADQIRVPEAYGGNRFRLPYPIRKTIVALPDSTTWCGEHSSSFKVQRSQDPFRKLICVRRRGKLLKRAVGARVRYR